MVVVVVVVVVVASSIATAAVLPSREKQCVNIEPPAGCHKPRCGPRGASRPRYLSSSGVSGATITVAPAASCRISRERGGRGRGRRPTHSTPPRGRGAGW